MQKYVIFLLLFLNLSTSKAQNDTIQINFHYAFGAGELKLDHYYSLDNSDSIEINTLKFYISNLVLLNDDEPVLTEAKSYHLINAEDKNTSTLKLPIDKRVNYNTLSFNLGIDSLTNVSGVMANDLDPSNNMYWTWQSGYINIKLEGHSNQSLARKSEFKFHLGGYQYPFNSLQKVQLKVIQSDSIEIELDLAEVISEMKLAELDHVMSPSLPAVEMSVGIANKFHIQIP